MMENQPLPNAQYKQGQRIPSKRECPCYYDIRKRGDSHLLLNEWGKVSMSSQQFYGCLVRVPFHSLSGVYHSLPLLVQIRYVSVKARA